MFSDSATEGPANEAEASKEGRINLIKKAVNLTIQHPIFGVGAGMFPLAAWGKMDAHVTHNTYVQVSSETGIPGFLIYMAAIVLSFRVTGRIMKLAQQNAAATDVFMIVFAIRAGWVILIVAACFGSFAYGLPMMVLLGLTEVLRKTAATELAAVSRSVTRSPVRTSVDPLVLIPRFAPR
jgi:hypothetical protein